MNDVPIIRNAVEPIDMTAESLEKVIKSCVGISSNASTPINIIVVPSSTESLRVFQHLSNIPAP